MTHKPQKLVPVGAIEDALLVLNGQVERASRPGKWRAFINDEGSLVLEIFKDATDQD